MLLHYLFRQQTRLGVATEKQAKKTRKKIGAIHSARWMGKQIAMSKGELYQKLVPETVLSQTEMKGNCVISLWARKTKNTEKIAI